MVARELRTLIVDDEPVAREILRDELSEIPAVKVIGEAADGGTAVSKIEALSPDLVILDIQMPVKDGFDVVRAITGPLPNIIFVTAFSEHALRAFEVGAVDYLLKPVRSERIRQAVKRAAVSRLGPVSAAEGIVATLDAADESKDVRRLKVIGRRGSSVHLLDLSEIFAFEADGEIVWIFTADAKFMATRPLRLIEADLEGTNFLRVHRAAIVNLETIRTVSNLSSGRHRLKLQNGLEFTASKRQAPLLRDWLR